MPSVERTRMPRIAIRAACMAALVQVAIFSAQSAFAPSQSMPVTSPIMLNTQFSTSLRPPPNR